MRAELNFFGRTLDMARQRRRRALVVVIYAALAVLMAVLYLLTHWRGSGAYMFWAAMLACRLFLGGYYNGGLVKPFNNRPPRQYAAAPPLLLLKLRIYQPVLPDDDTAYRNDERELNQKDRAHYLAYQAVGVSVIIPMFLASLRIMHPALLASVPMTPDQMYYGLLLITLTLFLTLPQSILLWTEPDMEEEKA